MTDLATLAALVALALGVAVVAFRYLPSRANASGPLGVLGIKLSGGFAAFVVTFLLLLQALGSLRVEHRVQLWTVTGRIVTDGASSPTQAQISFRPPHPAVLPDGSFTIQVPVTEQRSDTWQSPTLIVGMAGYAPKVIQLEGAAGYGGAAWTLERDGQRIRIVEPLEFGQ